MLCSGASVVVAAILRTGIHRNGIRAWIVHTIAVPVLGFPTFVFIAWMQAGSKEQAQLLQHFGTVEVAMSAIFDYSWRFVRNAWFVVIPASWLAVVALRWAYRRSIVARDATVESTEPARS